MKHLYLTALCVAVALGTAGCKIVPNTAEDDSTPAADARGDDARLAALLNDTYETALLPHITARAQTVAALRAQLAAGYEAAGQAQGARGAGAGAPWNFALHDTGKVVAANLQSRARTLDLDTDADGAADVTLQLGPVVKGSALRDFAPQIYVFTAFRDQIEFAKLGRALNDRASAKLTPPEGDPLGKTVTFTGVMPLKSATDAWLVTPVVLEFAP